MSLSPGTRDGAEAEAQQASLAPARLFLPAHPDLRAYLLDRDETVIGRSPDADIVVPEPLASRRHASISRDPWGYAVVDLGSRNGTLLNGALVSSPRRLRNGDMIQVGTTVMRFDDPSATLGASARQPLANLPVWVNEATGEAFAHGRVLELAPKELALLSLLCERAGSICDRPDIAVRVWPEYAGRIGDNNIEALVRRLRQKLAEAGAPPDTVVTVKKRGYRLAGVIEAGVMGPSTAGR